MDRIELDSVLAVDDCLSFSEAAYQLSFSQSAISKHVSAVEDELGVKLFNRKTHSGVSRTKNGEALMPELRKCSEAFKALFAHADALRQKDDNHLRVSCHAGIGSLGEDELITDFCSLCPSIRVDQNVDKDGKLPGKSSLEGVDLVFSLMSAEELFKFRQNRELDILPLRECSPQVLLPKSHPAAQGDSVDLKSLRNETFLFRPILGDVKEGSDGKQLQLFISACGSEGFSPDIRFVQLRSATVISMVSAGLGALLLMCRPSFLPENAVLLPLSKNYYTSILCVYYYKNNASPALRSFLNFLRSRSTYAQLP